MKNLALILALYLAAFMASTFGQTERTVETGVLTLKEQASAPSSPSSGKYKSYVRSGKLRIKTSAGVESTVGTGAGGDSGVNVLQNNGFEDGITTGWTSSGGTFSSGTYTNATETETKYASFVATTSGQYFESSAYATPDSVRGGCVAYLDYYTTDTASWKIQVYDGSSNLLSEQSLGPKDWQRGLVTFPCVAVGTTIKMRIISLAAGTIYGDRAYLGKENRVVSAAHAKLAGESYFATASSAACTRASATVGALTCNAAFPGPTILSSSMGSWQTTDVNLPEQTVNNLPPGRYKATFYITSYLDSASYTGLYINDGTTTCTAGGQAAGTGNQSQGTVSCFFDYTSTGNRSFELYVGTNAGTNFNLKNDITSPSIPTHFVLEYFPLDTQTAVVPDAQGWYISASIGGANPTSTNVTTYKPWENGSLTLTQNTGSATAKIACAGGTTSNSSASPSTCTSFNEQVGVYFTNPEAGSYMACIAAGGVSSTGQVMTLALIETAIGSDTVIQTGKSHPATMSNGTANSIAWNGSFCSVFYFSSVAERAIKYAYEADGAGNTIYMDNSTSYGQRDVHFMIFPLSQAASRAYLTGDQITTPGAANPVFYSATVSSAGTVSNEIGDLFNGNCSLATSTYTCTFTASKFSGTPNCFVTTSEASATVTRINSTSSSQVVVYGYVSTSAATNSVGFNIGCHGLKP